MMHLDEERARLLFKLFIQNLPDTPAQKVSKIIEKISQKNDIPFDELDDDILFKSESIDPEEGRKTYEDLQRMIPGMYLIGLENLPPYIEALERNLKQIKSQNEYSVLSNRSVNTLLDMVIYPVDKMKSNGLPPQKYVRLAYSIIKRIEHFDMNSHTTERYEKIQSEFSVYLKKYGGNNNDNCFIATMVYGNINHPQVFLLRQYRDDVLSQNIYGRTFIKVYYSTSPFFVEIFKKNRIIKSWIRKIIRFFILKIIIKQ